METDGRANEGRVALVTGSTSGIGVAIAKRLATDGFTLAFHSRSTASLGQALAQEHPGATYTRADLADPGQARSLVADVLRRHGRLDVLVNNAGISRLIPHDDLKGATAELWREIHEVNVIAPWTLVAEAEDALRAASTPQRSSCVLNITSHAGIRPKGASIPYSASKAALTHVTKLLALALSPQIRVNGIAPGLVDTPMTASWVDAHALWKSRAPMGRGARPEEIAQVASMLVGSSYLTAEIVLADGGLNLT